MVVTLIRNKKGQLKTRKYNRIKPSKAQYRSLRESVYWVVIIGLILILGDKIVHAQTTFETKFVEVQKERIIFVEEVSQDKAAKKLCDKYDMPDTCWRDLKAMRGMESTGGKYMTGDGGKSTGFYHIQNKLHNVSVECTMNFECSTEWTIKNLITNNYKTNRKLGLTAHNGVVKGSTYAQTLIKLSNTFLY